jgi:lipopolysaccharide/colanic/teichoic acid biosynthesis glycosyltransferase
MVPFSTSRQDRPAGFGQTFTLRSGIARLAARMRVQLLVGLLFAVILPAFGRWQFDIIANQDTSANNTLIGTAIAVVAGYVIVRKFAAFPGVQAISYVLPAFLTAYGILISIFFFVRIEYSRYQVLVSFVLAVIWFIGVLSLERRVRRGRFAVLPFGDTRDLLAYELVDWTVLRTPVRVPSEVNGIVADLRADLPPEWEKFLARCVLDGLPVYHIKQASESLTGRVQIEHLSENSLGSLLPSSIYARLKRVIDFIAAIALLPLIIPLGLVTAIAIKLDSRGTVLFQQARMGYRGKVFTIYKFRTMSAAGDEGSKFTEGGDPRVTRVGWLLRRYRIDELPQVINILKGEMSWIGPRPEALPLSHWYEREIPFYGYRHIVRPGISGWAQVQQGYAAKLRAVTDKLHYDFYYVKYFSAWLDVLIVMKTVRTILTGFGAR